MLFSAKVYSFVRVALMASVFLGPFAGLAAYKADPQARSGGIGFVLMMSLQRGALS